MSYVWVNMVQVLIWCMCLCWFTNLRCLCYIYWCSGMQMSKWAGCLVEWIYCFPFTGSNLELLAEPEELHHEEKLVLSRSRLLTLHLQFFFLLWFQFALHFGGACWDYLLLICCVPIFFFPVARCEQVEIDGQVRIRSDPSCSYHRPEIRHDAVSFTSKLIYHETMINHL